MRRSVAADPTPTGPLAPIKVTISDPETGEVFEEAVVQNDYLLICAGTAYLNGTQAHANGTHVLTVKGALRGR